MADNPHRIAKSFKKWFEFCTVRCTIQELCLSSERGHFKRVALFKSKKPLFFDFQTALKLQLVSRKLKMFDNGNIVN